MHRRSLAFALLLVALALPLSASQFVTLPFDQVAREATYVVRGTLGATWSAWDDAHQVIYTYSTVRVNRYFGETTGPDTLIVREVGGRADGYTQEAIGFPVLREGEEVVLMLSRWEDSADYRIHAFNQGKFLVKNRGGIEVLTEDPVKQGDERLARPRFEARNEAAGAALTMREFAEMVTAARAGEHFERPRN
ncbi:MAG: hypothetical protein QOH21_2334 [Acidobacteriota bacterium]|jgi:hypothetical protein|nr:hypothetical protein [Acidobacteriota bacterium]